MELENLVAFKFHFFMLQITIASRDYFELFRVFIHAAIQNDDAICVENSTLSHRYIANKLSLYCSDLILLRRIPSVACILDDTHPSDNLYRILKIALDLQ